MKKFILLMTIPMLLAACKGNEEAAKVPAIDLADLNTEVAPGDDFYQYACGGWIASHPLGAEYARFGSFDVLRENNVDRLNELFAEMAKMTPAPGTIDQKIVDLYKQGLDSVRLNAEGAAPLKKYLDKVYSATTKAELARTIAELNFTSDGGFFGVGVSSDLMDSNMQVLYMGQGGLGMGDRDYYVDKSNAELHSGYQAMLTRFFTLAGCDNAAKRAADAVSVEDQLAKFSWTRVQNREVVKLYNPMSTEQIIKTYSGFDFAGFFKAMDIPAQDKVIVEQPSFFEGFSKLFAKTDLEVLRNYVAATVINNAASSLSDEFYQANFDFYSTQMSGIKEQKPRWKRAMSRPNSILGEAVGQMYVKKYFPERNKQMMVELVKNLQVSLGQHIEALDWMSDQTKAYALEKLSTFTVKIGYPDKWKDYTSLVIDPELSYLDNLAAAGEWYVRENLSKMGQPTDKEEWGMTPQTVNAYYNPTTNEICFPAAILQPPFFNADADAAVNYGAIGVVIGHEMTHGFDDQGRMFDKDGNMNVWWTEEDAAAFTAKAEILKKQYSAIEILPGLFADGALSLGENIADQGGLSIAWTALQNALGGNQPAPIDGFTAAQRFYLGYAHLWAQNITDEEKARLTKLDVHSLGKNRVNAAVRNFQQFYDAFGIKEGDPMWMAPEDRVIIW